MLAQSFKTAEELGITEKQKEALMKTLVLLETGKLVHTSLPRLKDRYVGEQKFSGHFNMEEWSVSHFCGTIACIGGTAELIGGLLGDERFIKLYRSIGHSDLHHLFYPNLGRYPYSEITVEQAAQALRNYLTSGKPQWNTII